MDELLPDTTAEDINKIGKEGFSVMPRIPRLLVKGEPAVYHVMSRTALDGFVLQNPEKDRLLQIIQQMSQVFFVEVLGFCIMGNHFHLLVRMLPADFYDDHEMLRRFTIYYGPDIQPVVTEAKLKSLREKWSSLSEYMKEIKQRFSRYYNKKHDRRGYFWGDRFKSVIVEKGDTLINCLAYIDLNPVRAGICKKPEEYPWSSLGYHAHTGNNKGFLSTDFGLSDYQELDDASRLISYRRFVYEKAGISEIKTEAPAHADTEAKISRFLKRTRYFTDSTVIGTKEFIANAFSQFSEHFRYRQRKRPIPIKGLAGIYSLKRLSE